MPWRRIRRWWRGRKTKGPDADPVMRALQALRWRKEHSGEEPDKPPPEKFTRDEAGELIHLSGHVMQRRELWEKLRRHMEEHPGGKRVDLGGGLEMYAPDTEEGKTRIFGLECSVPHKLRGPVPHMMLLRGDGTILHRGEGRLQTD